MKKSTAIELAGSRRKLARLFGISGSAVSQWGEDIPPLRAFQLREKLLKAGDSKEERS